MSQDCVKFAPLLSATERDLPAAEREAALGHLSGCEACQARLADLEALHALVGPAVMARANAVDFSNFADQVMAKVGSTRQPFWTRLFARRGTIAALLAPALAAAALLLYLGQGSTGGEEFLADAGDVDIESEGHDPTVIQTSDGPVVLLGDDTEET
jgi:anti-sigma factor RsiW